MRLSRCVNSAGRNKSINKSNLWCKTKPEVTWSQAAHTKSQLHWVTILLHFQSIKVIMTALVVHPSIYPHTHSDLNNLFISYCFLWGPHFPAPARCCEDGRDPKVGAGGVFMVSVFKTQLNGSHFMCMQEQISLLSLACRQLIRELLSTIQFL